jgi:hypothetical protein
MKKIPLILVLAFFAVLFAGDIRDFFVRDEGVTYFTGDWQRLFYVLAIGLAGGLFFGLFALFSKKMQARIKFWLLGFAAAGCTCLTILFLTEMTRLGIWASQNIHFAEIILIFAGSFLVDAILWFEFWFFRKKNLTIK